MTGTRAACGEKRLDHFASDLCCRPIAVAVPAVRQTTGIDADGFIRNWLMLAPIPIHSEIFKFVDTRVLEKDTDRVDVTLAKGQNVLVLKVVNEVNNWQGCARFLQGTSPVRSLEISLTPGS
jgi:hypothetical protein